MRSPEVQLTTKAESFCFSLPVFLGSHSARLKQQAVSLKRVSLHSLYSDRYRLYEVICAKLGLDFNKTLGALFYKLEDTYASLGRSDFAGVLFDI